MITDEFRDMVAKLLQPIKDRVDNIPDPVAGSGPGLEKIPEAALKTKSSLEYIL